MVRIKSAAEFENLLNALATDIMRADAHWRMHKDILDALSNDADVFSQSLNFWRLTLDAHQHMAVHCLSRAYDSHRSALHLGSWLETIQENLHLFSEDNFRQRLADNPFVDSLIADPRMPGADQLKADAAACSDQDAAIKELVNYRNNRGAHRNAGISKNGPSALSEHVLNYETIDRLTERARKILNRYSNLFKASVYSQISIGKDDYKAIFELIGEALEQREKTVAKQLYDAVRTIRSKECDGNEGADA